MADRRWIMVTVAALALMLGTSVATAGTLSIEYSKYSNNTYTGFIGGEFTVYDIVGATFGTPSDKVWLDRNANGIKDEYQTFCLEVGEDVLGEDFTVAQGAVEGGIGNAATYAGDVGGVGLYDPLSEATKWLYLKFWAGELDALGYFYDVAGTNPTLRADWAESLQWAIWWLENETTAPLLQNPNAILLRDTAIAAVQDANYVPITTVVALNLTKNGEEMQSQIIVVPLPASALMGLGLLCALGTFRSIKRRKNRV